MPRTPLSAYRAAVSQAIGTGAGDMDDVARGRSPTTYPRAAGRSEPDTMGGSCLPRARRARIPRRYDTTDTGASAQLLSTASPLRWPLPGIEGGGAEPESLVKQDGITQRGHQRVRTASLRYPVQVRLVGDDRHSNAGMSSIVAATHRGDIVTVVRPGRDCVCAPGHGPGVQAAQRSTVHGEAAEPRVARVVRPIVGRCHATCGHPSVRSPKSWIEHLFTLPPSS